MIAAVERRSREEPGGQVEEPGGQAERRSQRGQAEQRSQEDKQSGGARRTSRAEEPEHALQWSHMQRGGSN